MTKKTQNFNYFKIDKYPHMTLATELFNTDLEHCHHCGKSYWAMLTILHLSVLLYVLLGVTALLNWRRQWQPTPVLLPGKSHGRRSLVGCSPWGREELDTTEGLHFHFSLSCIGEGNGNPLQCSCLENPRDGGSLMGCRLWGHTE